MESETASTPALIAAEASTPAPVVPLDTPQVEPYRPGAVSPSQAETLVSWIKEDLAAGKMTPEQADKAFAQMNIAGRTSVPLTPGLTSKNTRPTVPPAKPEEYRINYGEPGKAPPEMTPELQQADSAIRTWLSEAGVHRELGNSLTNVIGDVTRATAGKTEAELELYGNAEYEKLERMYGTLGVQTPTGGGNDRRA